MTAWVIQFLLGLFVANAGEWFVHRYLLHGLGQQADSFWAYYFLHRQAHCNHDWAKTYLPWHYHHHMTNDEVNWCITHPLFDYLMNTRGKALEKS